MSDLTHVSFLNFVTTDSVTHNIETVRTLAKQAKDQGAQWICLPEMWTHQSADIQAFLELSHQASQEVLPAMQDLAKELSITLFAGSWTETQEGQDKCFNTQYVIGTSGEVLAKYRKVHLFKMDDGSDNPYRETKKFIPGDELCVAEVDSRSICLSTCFDVRFPTMYIEAARTKPLDVITVPSAFIQSTGRDHWEVLLKARAIENQAFVLASNRIGAHPDPRINAYFGHSMVIDPWGKTLLDTRNGQGVFGCTIDWNRLAQVRKLLPLRKVWYAPKKTDDVKF